VSWVVLRGRLARRDVAGLGFHLDGEDDVLEVVYRNELDHRLPQFRDLAGIRVSRPARIDWGEPPVDVAAFYRLVFLLGFLNFLRSAHGKCPGADGERSSQLTAAQLGVGTLALRPVY